MRSLITLTAANSLIVHIAGSAAAGISFPSLVTTFKHTIYPTQLVHKRNRECLLRIPPIINVLSSRKSSPSYLFCTHVLSRCTQTSLSMKTAGDGHTRNAAICKNSFRVRIRRQTNPRLLFSTSRFACVPDSSRFTHVHRWSLIVCTYFAGVTIALGNPIWCCSLDTWVRAILVFFSQKFFLKQIRRFIWGSHGLRSHPSPFIIHSQAKLDCGKMSQNCTVIEPIKRKSKLHFRFCFLLDFMFSRNRWPSHGEVFTNGVRRKTQGKRKHSRRKFI